MIYKDRIYGKIEISEPLILELIKTPTIQRLKGIDQAGYRKLWVKPNTKMGKYDHSRFAHSLGVYILLKRYKASFEEQITGLIHDVSHLVFSHCIDYALDEGSEKYHVYQDKIHKDFVKKSEIPSILKKHGFDVNYFLEKNNFPILERELPDLCADRIDYSLRTAIIFDEIKKEDINYFLKNLIVENNNWVFENLESAKKYAKLFLKLNSVYYAGFKSAVMFRVVGDLIKYALLKGYVVKKDLYTTDEEVLAKIKKNLKKDKKLKLLFDRMNNKMEFRNNPEDFDAHVFCKSRIVDPFCRYSGEIKRVSEVDKGWVEVLEKESIPKEYFIKFKR